jgi:hypothetical protein
MSTVAQLLSHIGRLLPRDCEVLAVELSVLVDPAANLVLTLAILDEDAGEDTPDDGEKLDGERAAYPHAVARLVSTRR